MFWKFVTGAVRLRRNRLSLAAVAMAVGCALVTAVFTVYMGVEKKVAAQFQAYGANVLIAPAGGALTVPLEALEEVRKLGGTAAPFLYWLGKDNGRAVGVDPARAGSLLSYWHIEGQRGACMAGAGLGLKVGDTARAGGFSCRVDGVVSTGGAEDSQLILPFETVARLAGLRKAASVVQVRIPAERVDELRKAVPTADVRLVRAVAQTEANVVLKVRLELFLLTLVILAIVTVSVSSNFGELVMERSKEIGILKAIGAGERKIAALFLAEALILAALSIAAGYASGIVLAGWIEQSVFEATFGLHLNWRVFGLAALATFAVAAGATGLAAGRIWRIQPAGILRGE